MTRIADSWMDQISDNHTDNAVGMKKSAYEDYIIRNQDESRFSSNDDRFKVHRMNSNVFLLEKVCVACWEAGFSPSEPSLTP